MPPPPPPLPTSHSAAPPSPCESDSPVASRAHAQSPASHAAKRQLRVLSSKIVTVEPHLEQTPRAQEARLAVVAWYRQHAQERLPERVLTWADELGLAAPRVLIREQRLRWGSCDASGTLRLNWRIVQAPTRLIDYVVVHELAHLLHRDHTRAFWATLAKVIPDYEADKMRLLKLGPRLTW